MIRTGSVRPHIFRAISERSVITNRKCKRFAFHIYIESGTAKLSD